MKKEKFKKKCNFRSKIKACRFNAEDCNSDNCVFYYLDWKQKPILDKCENLVNIIKERDISLTELKAEIAEKREQYKKIKNDIRDKFYDVIKMRRSIQLLEKSKKRKKKGDS